MRLEDTNHRNDDVLRTHEEIAAIMTKLGHPMCRGRVWQIERSALKKIARHPLIRKLAEEYGLRREPG